MGIPLVNLSLVRSGSGSGRGKPLLDSDYETPPEGENNEIVSTEYQLQVLGIYWGDIGPRNNHTQPVEVERECIPS